MFGWRKREQGFEWHKYVRTTIKLRREARRDKAEQIKQQAADSVKAAGVVAADSVAAASAAAAERLKAASAVAADGAKVAGAAAGAAARQSAQKLGAGSRIAAEGLGRKLAGLAAGFGRIVDGQGQKLIKASQPAMEFLSRPPLRNALLIVGTILLVGGLFRWGYLKLLDSQALVVSIAGAVALACAFLPRLLLASAPPLPPWLGNTSQRIAAAGAFAAAIVVVGIIKLVPSISGLATIATLPRLPFSAPEIVEGRASVATGDVIRIGQRGVRLSDLEFPDREQTCVRPGNKRWRCGDAAQAMLSRLANGRNLKCEINGRDDAGNALAVCKDGASELNAELVKSGHVFAASGLLSRYGSLESDAQARKAGVWAGEVLRPAEWRQKLWDEALRRAPSGCPIKGQVMGNARTYVLPWSADYERVRVNASRGGRWFCSEEEAIAAGWKVAGRG